MNIFEFKDKLIEEAKKISNYDDLKYVDKKISIPIIAFIIVSIIFYYYYLFSIYPAQQQEKAKKAAELARQKQQQVKVITTTDYTSMGASPSSPSTNNTNPAGSSNTPKPGKASKIPANHILLDVVPNGSKDMYLKAFDVMYDYFEQINTSNFGNVVEYLDPEFKSKNNITTDTLYNFYRKFYFENNYFLVDFVEKNDNIYIVTLLIENANAKSSGFYTDYKLIEKNGKLFVTIEALPEYLKTVQ